ncbi:MAG: hypothetical protein AAGA17_19220 [Actinomycetota bacterium]
MRESIDETNGFAPAVIELEDDPADALPVGADPVSEVLRRLGADDARLVGRDPLAVRVFERADGQLDRWQVALLRWRFRMGWPVTPERSRVARLSDLSADDAVAAFASAGRMELGGVHVRWDAPGPGRRAARELIRAEGTCELPWSWPALPISLAVAEWSGRRCQLVARIRPGLRPRWPRRWFETAHLTLIELDAALRRGALTE